MKIRNNQKGITLVALVVTVIVLLILAGVSIGIIFNSDGLFSKTSESAKRYNQKKAEEALNLVLSDAKIKKYSPEGLTNEDLDNMIKDIGGVVDEENLNKVTIGGYDFEIDRNKLEVINILGENPNVTPGGGSQGGGEESKKQESILTLSATSGTIPYPNDATITITKNTSDGELSVESSDDSIASASISENKITITPKLITEKEKEVVITVKTAETEKFKEQIATYTATVKQGGIIINAIPNTIQHDGTAYSAFSSVEVTPEDATVEYSLNDSTYQSEIPMITEVGEYTITIKATKEGYAIKETSITVTVLESVARVGTAYYNTLQRAINSVPTTNTNTTVVVLKDVTEDVSVKENMNVTLNLNNCTLTGTMTNLGTIDISGGTVTSQSNVIINQTEGTVIISETANIDGPAEFEALNNYGELRVQGGTLTSQSNVIINRAGGTVDISGTVKINGVEAGFPALSNYGELQVKAGTLTSPSYVIANRAGGKATISGGTINGIGSTATLRNHVDAELIITGGTITSKEATVVSNSGTTEISGTAKIEGKVSGYVGIANNGILQVKGGTITSPSNVISNQTGGKTTISGGTINGTGSNTISNYPNAEITITGGTVNCNENYALYNYANAKVTITGGILTSESSCVICNLQEGIVEISGTAKIENKTDKKIGFNNSGILNIKGGTLISPANVIGNQTGGKVTISGGTINASGYATLWNKANAEITITGGTINCSENYALDNGANAKAIITGGALTSESSCAICNSQEGTVEISGTAKIENKTDKQVMINNMGTLQVKGGTMTSPGNTIYGRESSSTIEISGGTITGTGNYPTIYILLGTFKMTAGTVTNSVGSYGVYNGGGTSVSHTGGTISKKNF